MLVMVKISYVLPLTSTISNWDERMLSLIILTRLLMAMSISILTAIMIMRCSSVIVVSVLRMNLMLSLSLVLRVELITGKWA